MGITQTGNAIRAIHHARNRCVLGKRFLAIHNQLRVMLFIFSRKATIVLTCTLITLASSGNAFAQALTNGLVAYWPLDEILADKTPDVASGYDMQVQNMTQTNIVAGIRSNAFSFFNSRQTLLSRVHAAGEDLPINKHAAFTISMWTKVNGPGQTDLRVFSEGNTAVSDPLFNLGTQSTGGSGQLDIFIRPPAPPRSIIS